MFNAKFLLYKPAPEFVAELPEKEHLLIIIADESLKIPLPEPPELLVKLQLLMIVEELHFTLAIPAPTEPGAELPEKIQKLMLGADKLLHMPPPPFVAVLPEKVQSLKYGVEFVLYTPPPVDAELPKNVELLICGVELSFMIPPP